MRIDQKRINKEVADENFLDEEILKSISDVAFKEWSNWTKKPTSLILKVDYLGKNYFRRKKTQQRLNAINNYREEGYYKDMEESFKFILEEYEKFTKEKQLVRYGNIDKNIE